MNYCKVIGWRTDLQPMQASKHVMQSQREARSRPASAVLSSEFACLAIQPQLKDADFYADDPIQGDFPNWNNDSCLPSPQAPCTLEGFPSMGRPSAFSSNG